MKLTLKICIFLCALCLCGRLSAGASELVDITQTVEGNKTELTLRLTKKTKPNVFVLQEGGARIVVDIPHGKLTSRLEKRAGGTDRFQGKGGVKHIRYARRGKDNLRLVADLNADAIYMSRSYKDGVLRVFIQDKSVKLRDFSGIAFPRLKPQPVTKIKQELIAEVGGIPVPRLKRRTKPVQAKKLVVVIDPGHGGRDPGSIGGKKTREETVTLKAALELRKQLLKTGRYKVVLTRSSDTYVTLENRVVIARKAGADLFISLHADSLSKPSIRGASVYTLADRAQKRVQEVTQTQNWILDVDLASHSAPVADILVDLAQRSTLSKSAEFADILIPNLKKQTVLLGNTHRRAGLYVLLAPDVPAVLLEMGFLSNKKDEALLNSAKHRKKLMKSVTKAINSYFTAQTTLQASR